MALKEIGVRTVVENLGAFLSGMDRYNAAIARAEQRTARFSATATRAGAPLAAIGAAFVAVAAISAKSAIQLESAMIGVRKTVDATEQQFADLERQFRDTALVVPIAAVELARLAEVAGQLGIETDNISSFVRVMADLGVTTNLAAEEAATALARIANITGLAQDQFDRMGSTIVALGNNLATTEAEITTFGLRIAGAGRIAGITEAEILAIGAAMSSVGVAAEAGGTAIQKVLLAITAAAAQGGTELEVFAATAGLTVAQFEDLFRQDAAGAFTAFVEGLGAAGQDAFVILEELGLQDQRLIRGFLSLAGAGDLLRTSIDLGTSAWDDNIALMREAELRYGSTESQAILLQSAMTELKVAIGTALIPVLVELLEAVSPILIGLAEWIEKNPELTVTVVVLGTAVGVLGAALLIVGLALPGVIAGVGLLTGAVSALTGAVGALLVVLGPIGVAILAIGLITAAVLIIWKNWETVLKGIKVVLNAIISLINVLAEGLALLPKLFGFDVSIPNIPGFATGGTAGRTGAALVGERGPEVVNLPAGAQVSPISQTTNFNVNANYTNPQTPSSIGLDLQAISMMTRS